MAITYQQFPGADLIYINDETFPSVQKGRLARTEAARAPPRLPAGSDASMETMVTKSRSTGGTLRRSFVMGILGAVAGAVALAWCGLITPAAAADLSASDKLCLTCHSMPGLEKTLANGEKLPLHIDASHFADSVHGPLGCTGCHTNISLPSHPGAGIQIQSSRAFSIQMMQICANCHTQQYKEWTTSVHAALVKQGNPIAPVCTSCHSPHAVIKGAAESFNAVPCKTCHAAIYTAYAGSVHGMLRGGGVTQAPLCFSCHGAHAIHVPSEVQGLKDVCLGCHKDAVAAHSKWLPNVALHFDVVSCPACHVPHAQRRVDLVLYNNNTHHAMSEPRGIPEFRGPDGSPATGPTGLDPQTLFNLLRSLNKPGMPTQTVIKGRLEVSTAVQAHQIAPSSAAVHECATCHRAGSNAFDSVVVSVAGPAGIPITYGANKDVLRSAFSIASIGGFYAIGGTRITILDAILVLALLAGFGIPIAHASLRILFRHLLSNTHQK